MSSARLQQQFIRLWQCCEGRSQETTLNELAEMLSCSRRHMRTLLNMMEERGWLTWEAEAGRGKRSKLAFLYTGLALQQQRAEDLLEQDRIDQLVQLVGDKAAVRQMLVSPPRTELSPGAAYSARALLSADEKSAPRQRAAPFGKPYRPANLQRPDAGK
nr:SgrR [Raoultella sp. NCTC 9187]